MDRGMLTLCERHGIKISRGHILHPTLVVTVHWDLLGIPMLSTPT